jgi:hypothetical protein
MSQKNFVEVDKAMFKRHSKSFSISGELKKAIFRKSPE